MQVKRTGRSKELRRALADKAEGQVGFFESSKYADGTPVAYVAAIQEFGSPAQGIPPRPFMRAAVRENEADWNDAAARGGEAVAEGRWPMSKVTEAIAARAAGDVRKSISDLTSPALAETTIAARLRGRADKRTVGSLDKPLVHTGFLRNSVTRRMIKK